MLIPRMADVKEEKELSPRERMMAGWRLAYGWTVAQCERKMRENEELAAYRSKIDAEPGMTPEKFDRLVREKMLEIFKRRRG